MSTKSPNPAYSTLQTSGRSMNVYFSRFYQICHHREKYYQNMQGVFDKFREVEDLLHASIDVYVRKLIHQSEVSYIFQIFVN